MTRNCDFERKIAQPGMGARPDAQNLTPAQQAQIEKRWSAYESLAGQGRRNTKDDLRRVGVELGYGLRTAERHWRVFRLGLPKTGMLSKPPNGGRYRFRLDLEVEECITEVRRRMDKEHPQALPYQIVRAIRTELQRRELPVPSHKTLLSRVEGVPLRQRETDKLGHRAARRRRKLGEGHAPETDHPLQRIQIDHTLVDVVVCSRTERLWVGRPWITVAIDEHTRAILAFVLSFEYPSATTVAMVMTRAVLPKDEWMARLGIDLPYPMHGKPLAILVDNAQEFVGEAMKAGCDINNIAEPETRPKGEPQWGGIIERFIGTIMKEMRILDGATARDWMSKENRANPNETATMDIDQLEKDLALFITGDYHVRPHSHTKQQPNLAWERGVLGTKNKPGYTPRRVDEPKRFFIDFLDIETRTVQPSYGVRWDNLTYKGDVLQSYLDCDDGRSFTIRRNHMDVSSVYFLRPEDGEYYELPTADLTVPSITAYELELINQEIIDRGDKPDNVTIAQTALRREENMAEARRQTEAANATRRQKKNGNKARIEAEKKRKRSELTEEFTGKPAPPTSDETPTPYVPAAVAAITAEPAVETAVDGSIFSRNARFRRAS